MKMKTKKIVAKRFKLSKRGVLMRGHQNSRHLRANKSKKQIRRFKKPQPVSKAMEKMVRTFLPYR